MRLNKNKSQEMMNDDYRDWIFCIAPKGRPDTVQHIIQFVQRGIRLDWNWQITHTGICGPNGKGVEMRWPLGGYVDIYEKYSEEYNIYFCRLRNGIQSGLWESAQREMVRAPYAGLQLFGIFFKYVLANDWYARMPKKIKWWFKVCSESVDRSMIKVGTRFQSEIDPEYTMPAAFTKPMFIIEEAVTNSDSAGAWPDDSARRQSQNNGKPMLDRQDPSQQVTIL